MHVLLINPKSPHSFWTFDRLVKHLGKRALIPPLSLITVAALLPRAWALKLVDMEYQQITSHDWNWADAVFVSGMIVQKDSLIDVIRQAKGRGKRVVVGDRPVEPEVIGPIAQRCQSNRTCTFC